MTISLFLITIVVNVMSDILHDIVAPAIKRNDRHASDDH